MPVLDAPVDNEILDNAEEDDSIIPEKYDITSYGADLDVEGLVRRLQRDDIFIPPFQREYVWSQKDASRFIESLLLGLPVPGVFMAKEPDSNRLLVIDGQQRLKSVQFFFEGYFNPKESGANRKVFKLQKVQPQFEGKSISTLEEKDRITLRDTVIHATIVKQDSPSDNDTSIYHIFERLNTGGKKLAPQEIRTAIFHGPFIMLIERLNEYKPWRDIFGPKNSHLKDEELILRFIALLSDFSTYGRPMNEFLNKFAQKHRRPSDDYIQSAEDTFKSTIDAMYNTVGLKSFRPERVINAAVFDSVMVGIATRLARSPDFSRGELMNRYQDLLDNGEFRQAVSSGTSNEQSVSERISLSIAAFEDI